MQRILLELTELVSSTVVMVRKEAPTSVFACVHRLMLRSPLVLDLTSAWIATIGVMKPAPKDDADVSIPMSNPAEPRGDLLQRSRSLHSERIRLTNRTPPLQLIQCLRLSTILSFPYR